MKIAKLYSFLSHQYYWKGMFDNVKKLVESCEYLLTKNAANESYDSDVVILHHNSQNEVD